MAGTCRPVSEVLKDVRELGATPTQIKAANGFMQGVKKAMANNEVKKIAPKFTLDLKKAYRDKEVAVVFGEKTLAGTVNWLIGYEDGSTRVSIDVDGKEYVANLDVNGISDSRKMEVPVLKDSMKQVEFDLDGTSGNAKVLRNKESKLDIRDIVIKGDTVLGIYTASGELAATLKYKKSSINSMLKENDIKAYKNSQDPKLGSRKILMVDMLETNEGFEGNGYAEVLLDKFIQDNLDKEMFLWAYAMTNDTDQKLLEDFYSRKGFNAIEVDDDYGTYMYRPKHSYIADIGKAGTTLAHVSDVSNISKLIGAGDTYKVGENTKEAEWLGTHIGTYDVVDDYAKQQYANKVKYLYEVKVAKDLNILNLPDKGYGDWNISTTVKHLRLLYPDTKFNENMTNKELRKVLTDLGFDAIGYANSAEGRRSGNVDSLIILNSDSVEIVSNTEVGVGDSIATVMDSKGVVRGSKGGDSKVNLSKFKRIEKDVHRNIEAMQELVEELHKIGGEKESAGHLDYLKGLVGKLNPKFLTKMTTYINEKASETGGVMTNSAIAISVSKANRLAGNQQSEAEVYVHEVIHSYVAFALDLARSGDIEARKLYRELEYVMKVARENMTWKDFLPAESIDAKLEEKNAREMYKYIFDSANAEDEFIAHVLTNPIVMAKAEKIMLRDKSKDKSLWGKVKEVFESLMDLIAGNFEFSDRKKNIREITEKLAFRLAEYNNKAVVEAKKNESVTDRLLDVLNTTDEKLADKIEELVNEHMPAGVVGPRPKSVLGQAKWTAEVVSKMALDPIYRNQLSKLATAFGMPPEGTIQTIMRDFTEQDELTKTVDWMALASDRIDGFKMTLIGTVKEAVEKGFKSKLSKDEKKSLTRVVMDTDLASVFGKYSNAEMRRLLRDNDALETKIGRVKHQLKLKSGKNYYWNVNQASGLGYYLATGKAHIAQNMNAVNIARGLLSAEYRKIDKELVALIDEVATLTALKYTDDAHKLRVEKLMKEDWNGVRNVIGIAENLKSEAKNTLFNESSTHIVKGYTKEIFDDKITMEVATLDEKVDMEKRGFKLVKELDKHAGDSNKIKFGLYVSDSFNTSEWYRTTARLTKLGTKGTTLSSLWYASENSYAKLQWKTNKTKLDVDRINMVTSMYKGELDLTKVEYGLVPVLNEDGAVTDYRYMMDKNAKEDFLGMSTDIGDIVGRTRASIFDKGETDKHNQKLLDVIVRDAKENYRSGDQTGENDKLYVLITENSTDEKIKDLWKVLPKSFKEEAMKSKDKGLPVRRDLMNNYFGYRHLSVSNFPLLKEITPEIIKNLIRIAEVLWMEFIKISKVDVLIKMPAVAVGNIVSNFMYSVMTGTSPRELLKMYTESTRDVRAYLKKHREMVELKNAKATGNVRRLPVERIAQLERELKASPIHELYELGIYQAIVEDVSKDEFTSTNKLKQWYRDKTESVPTVIKDGLNWIYLTEETQYYKFMTEVVQMSDLVARDIENRKMKSITDRQKNGQKRLPKWFLRDHPGNELRKLSGKELKEFEAKSKEMRLDLVLNTFINYNRPSGSLEEYLNKVGLVMFTKYAKRIQRVIGQTGMKYPVKSLMTLLGQEFLLDVETIQDQSFLTKSWYNMGLGENDLIPGKPLFDYLMEVFTPTVMQASTYKLI